MHEAAEMNSIQDNDIRRDPFLHKFFHKWRASTKCAAAFKAHASISLVSLALGIRHSSACRVAELPVSQAAPRYGAAHCKGNRGESAAVYQDSICLSRLRSAKYQVDDEHILHWITQLHGIFGSAESLRLRATIHLSG